MAGVMILACSGASNAGQLANRAALELTAEGLGTMYCLMGLAAGLDSFLQAARQAEGLLLIEGCETGCGGRALKKAGFRPSAQVVVTQGLKIAKNKDFELKTIDVNRLKSLARFALAGGGTPPACGCGRP